MTRSQFLLFGVIVNATLFGAGLAREWYLEAITPAFATVLLSCLLLRRPE